MVKDKTIRVWSVRTGKEVINALYGHDGHVVSVAASKSNWWIISGSYGGAVRVWDVSGGKQVIKSLCGHEKPVSSVAVSDDCRIIASASSDWTVPHEYGMYQLRRQRNRFYVATQVLFIALH